MTTIKKYFAPVLVLSAALLLLSCGKDDNGNGGGNGGGEGGDPNPPVPTEKTTVWDSNSLHFAKLFGEVQKVDTLFDGVNTALFDRNGYITSYKIKGYDAANKPGGIRFPMHVQCRQPRYVDHERPNDGHVPVRRSRQVHRGRAGYFRIQPARLPVRFPAPVPEKPDVRRHQCPRPAARIRVRGQRRPDDGQGPRRHGLVRDDLCRRVSLRSG